MARRTRFLSWPYRIACVGLAAFLVWKLVVIPLWREAEAEHREHALVISRRTAVTKSVSVTCRSCRNGMFVKHAIVVDDRWYVCGDSEWGERDKDWSWTHACPCDGTGIGSCNDYKCDAHETIAYDPAYPSNCGRP